MPPHLPQNRTSSRTLPSDIADKDLGYEYPEGLDLRPSSKLHTYIRDEVMRRVRESYDVMSARHDKWDQIDKKLTAFIDLSEEEKKIKAADKNRPVSIVVPLSYATLQTLLTYWTSAFGSDNTIFKYEGRGPEDTLGAILLEHVIAYQSQRRKFLLALHTMWRDSLAFGIGVCVPKWIRVVGKKTLPQAEGFISRVFGTFIPNAFARESVETVKYEGNDLENIDPFFYFPDPTQPVHKVQDMEYVSWLTRSNVMSVLTEERYSKGTLFNARYLKEIKDGRSWLHHESSRKRNEFAVEAETTSVQVMDLIHMYIKLIPRDWGLGKGKYPEMWMFTLAADQVVIQANPVELDHSMFPIAVCAPEYDGHRATPISSIEVTYGLQEIVDFLFNSHISNVKKAINDVLIIDPFKLNMNDLKNPGAGGLVRLRRSAWGKGVEGSYAQLKVVDITQGNIDKVSYISEMVQNATGATDILQGVMSRTRDRVTAKEIRDSKMAALSRVEHGAKIGSLQAHYDLAYMCASHTQQYMDLDSYIKIAGEYENRLRNEYGIMGPQYKVSPIDLLVDFDVIPVDGSSQESESVEFWVQLFQTIVQAPPEIAVQFEPVRILEHIARLSGTKNFREFMSQGAPIQAQVLPDDIVQNRIDKGQIVPLQEAI